MSQLILEAMKSQLPAETLEETRLLLSGAVGSKLTGLDHEDSDVDRMALYAYSPDATMRALVGQNNTKEAFFNSDPDVFGYETVKVTSLLMKSNPPILNFLHSNTFEQSTEIGLELAELAKSRLLTLDALLRVFPASSNASFKESTILASKTDIEITQKTLVRETPKNVARKLKVAFIMLAQAQQALDNGVYQTKISNRAWFLETYPSLAYADAVELFQKEFAKVRNYDQKVSPFKAIYDEKDVEAMRDWVVRAKQSASK